MSYEIVYRLRNLKWLVASVVASESHFWFKTISLEIFTKFLCDKNQPIESWMARGGAAIRRKGHAVVVAVVGGGGWWWCLATAKREVKTRRTMWDAHLLQMKMKNGRKRLETKVENRSNWPTDPVNCFQFWRWRQPSFRLLVHPQLPLRISYAFHHALLLSSLLRHSDIVF